MKPVIIPPLVITQGKAFSQSWRIEDPLADPVIVPLAGWTGTFRLFTQPFDASFYSAALVIENDQIAVSIPGEVTAGFAALPILGGRPNGWYQLDLTAPQPDLSQVWQGSLTVAGVTAE